MANLERRWKPDVYFNTAIYCSHDWFGIYFHILRFFCLHSQFFRQTDLLAYSSYGVPVFKIANNKLIFNFALRVTNKIPWNASPCQNLC